MCCAAKELMLAAGRHMEIESLDDWLEAGAAGSLTELKCMANTFASVRKPGQPLDPGYM